jgi:hypothetical protein
VEISFDFHLLVAWLSLHVANRVARRFVFQTKNPNLGKFWRALEWKMLVYFMTIWNILRPFGITYGRLIGLVVIWYIFPNLVSLGQEKSGNPGCKKKRPLGGYAVIIATLNPLMDHDIKTVTWLLTFSKKIYGFQMLRFSAKRLL